jgi:hypothetical protein
MLSLSSAVTDTLLELFKVFGHSKFATIAHVDINIIDNRLATGETILVIHGLDHHNIIGVDQAGLHLRLGAKPHRNPAIRLIECLKSEGGCDSSTCQGKDQVFS